MSNSGKIVVVSTRIWAPCMEPVVELHIPGRKFCCLLEMGADERRTIRSALSQCCQMGLTESIGLPQTLFEKHEPWPAYVSYTSPAVRRLIDKSRARELESMRAAEENRKPKRQSKPSLMYLKRKKPSRSSGDFMLKDALSGTLWEPTFIPDPAQFRVEAREGPTSNYNKIIFSRRPAMRKLPYGLP
ncbi:CMT1A duplicated region transcript 4 protein [Acomys russatus]|uniref:CMT1A duplicated region transcript 4 protein n=1 Tax=Acomys russatus TaxID=60746 RepID=UPI0021E29B51|nr:CMT1A duplicated region transcript 4 protein [Acomys russatus]